MDDTIQGELSRDITWVHQEMPVSSIRDLILGHVIGMLYSQARITVTLQTRSKVTDEDDETIKIMLKRRLPEIIQKINKSLGR